MAKSTQKRNRKTDQEQPKAPVCECLQDEICDACRKASALKDDDVLNNLTRLYDSSETCRGCDGKKVQYRHSDGINILCPVCKGSGKMPAPPHNSWTPWPMDGYPSYPWQHGQATGVTPPPFPGQIID